VKSNGVHGIKEVQVTVVHDAIQSTSHGISIHHPNAVAILVGVLQEEVIIELLLVP
jgi:hypothetical protein